MRLISFLNGKGGVGKTTCSVAVAWCLALMGYKVALCDTDPQGSVTSWFNGDVCPFDVYSVSDEKEIYNLRKTLNNYDYVVIDGAATISAISAAAVMVSDIVLIPVTASPLDFAACAGVLAVIEARSALKPVTARFIQTKRVTNARMNETLRDSIEATGLHLMRSTVANRQSYVRSLLDGGSIFTGTDSQAKAEIQLLTKEILSLLA
ncbi:ParA family protein [Salmonella enterica]|nr:ParA family protein [Salmonella enterica]EHU5767749.1 ParA family protein [Salmonella enterica]